jgi:sulfoxide reductase heme-binding subunit YedZ
MQWIRAHWLRVLAHATGLVPLLLIVIAYARGTVAETLNRELTLHSGTAGLLLLLASLACTPLNTLFGWRQAIAVRRTLGLYGFGYVLIHLLSYAALDNLFDFELIWRDVGERRSMIAGFAALLALIPLALTSTRGWQRRLGRGWRALHRLVYVALPLSVLHVFWLERDFIRTPVVYALIVGGLLALRLPPLRRLIVRARTRRAPLA